MLRISKMADYATVILHCLSAEIRDLLSANEIAQQTHLSQPTVSKILKILLEAGLVISTRGVVGGYSLAKPPQQITIAQVITAIEGPPALTECSNATQRCAQDATCRIKHNWKTINQFILKTLENVTLADMLTPISFTHHTHVN